MAEEMGSARCRVLVTGATGMLGRQVMRELSGLPLESRGLCYSRQHPDCTRCDLTNEAELRRVLLEYRPDVVIHCAAARRPDQVHLQPEASHKLNVGSTRMLADACVQSGAWLVFLSTDYVFDGSAPPYAEDAVPKPLSLYGLQKQEAEQVVLGCATHAVLRVPLLFGSVEFLDESSVTDLYLRLLTMSLTKVDHRQRRYPTSVEEVASVLGLMVTAHINGTALSGVFHWQAEECFTKFQMVKAISQVSGIDSSEVHPDTAEPKYPCPLDSQLSCSRLLKDVVNAEKFHRRPFVEVLAEAIQPWMVRSVFDKVLGAQGTISRGLLTHLIMTLDPDVSRQSLDDFFNAANIDEGGRIDLAEFLQLVFG